MKARDEGLLDRQINVRLDEDGMRYLAEFAGARMWKPGQLGRMVVEAWIKAKLEAGADPRDLTHGLDVAVTTARNAPKKAANSSR
jgi:hypothetical protein